MPQSSSTSRFSTLKSVHIVGVCGTLMAPFAAFLKRKGVRVTGSDQNVYPPMSDLLKNAGVEVFSGYNADNLTGLSQKPDLVIIGNVIGAQNPEARVAIDQGYVYASLPETMEKFLLPSTRNIVVSGTHGKTTTSSMMGHCLLQAGKDPSYFIGGVPTDLPFSFQVSEAGVRGEGLFVLEGDEYDTAFWDKVPKFTHYLPDDVILISVEYDHADIYPDFQAVYRAFEGLVDRVRPGGRMIACTDFPAVGDLIKKAKVPVITYGLKSASGVRFTVADIRNENGLVHFDVLDGGKKVERLTLQVPGNHNIANALAAWIEGRELGIPSDVLRAGLASFRGVKRRQEVRGEVRGVMVMDDFAHHPTAVRETLRALKAKYSGRRLVAVFEPRSATSRRKVFQADYVSAFQEADATFISVPFDQSKIASDDQFSSDQLVDDLHGKGSQAQLMDTVEAGVVQVAKFSKSGDLVAVLSNGGFGGFIPKLLEELAK